MWKRLHLGYNNHEEKTQAEGEDMDVAKDSELEIKKMCKDTGVFRKRLSSIFFKLLGGSFLSKTKTGNFRNQEEGREQGMCFVEGSNGTDQPFVLNGPAFGHKYCRKQHKHVWKGDDHDHGVENQFQGMYQSFFDFFDNKKSWNFIEENINRVNENCYLSIRRHGKVGNAAAIRVTSSFRFVGRQECAGGRDKIRMGMIIRRRKLKIVRSSYKKMNKQDWEEEDGGDACLGTPKSYSDNELCRKRILMGARCKPLNSSGTLMYDKNGYLIPDLM